MPRDRVLSEVLIGARSVIAVAREFGQSEMFTFETAELAHRRMVGQLEAAGGAASGFASGSRLKL